MRVASDGWCAPSELVSTVILGEDYTGDFLMLLPRACLPCEVGGIEHPLNHACADTVAVEWVEHAERTSR